jgi:hypothetical protein
MSSVESYQSIGSLVNYPKYQSKTTVRQQYCINGVCSHNFHKHTFIKYMND